MSSHTQILEYWRLFAVEPAAFELCELAETFQIKLSVFALFCYTAAENSGRDGEMNVKHDGRRLRVPASRRLTSDLLWLNRVVPLCGHDRIFRLQDLASARSKLTDRISWPALFIRAFSLVAQKHPELRQTWYRWPFSHLYQHPVNVASITVHRNWKNAAWLFWGQIDQPESSTLPQIQQQLDCFRDAPVEQVFRKQTRLAQLPTPLRRLIWWWNHNVATAKRAKRLGTFFVSTLAGRGAEIQIPPAIHTGCLTFGPLNQAGECRVTLAYDHRVMDGFLVAAILESLESVLSDQMLTELQDSSTEQPLAEGQAA